MVSKVTDNRTLRILICDPDQEFVREAEEILSSEGHTVMAEAGLPSAIRLALKIHPDVIVLPCEFVDDPGVDFFAEVIDSLTPRPAILLTCRLAHFDLAWEAWHKGADDCMFKPLLGGELKAAIAKVRSRAADRLVDKPQVDDEIGNVSR